MPRIRQERLTRTPCPPHEWRDAPEHLQALYVCAKCGDVWPEYGSAR